MGKCKKCKDPDCKATAGYGYKNGPRTYCRIHKANDMINLKGYICSHGDCTTRASYAYKKSDKKKYCAKHKKLNMINVLNRTCRDKDYMIQTNYNYE